MAKLLRVEEAARELALSRVTVYELIATGQLRSVKIGRSRRIPSEAVDAFVRAREADSAIAESA